MERLMGPIKLILLVLLFHGISTGKLMAEKTEEAPNVLLIITDQQTADAMSCAGNQYLKTPALDKLASSGIRFTRNYVTQPLCLPFRSSLQTSRYPHELGIENNQMKIKGEFPMLGNLMMAAGYQCYYIGKWHVGTSPQKAGYENYDNVGKDDAKTEAAINYLGQEHDHPFFLTVSLMNPHNVCELARANADGSNLPDGRIALPPSDLGKLPPLPTNFKVSSNEPSVIRVAQNNSFKQYPTADWNELTWRQYLWGYYRLVEKVDAEVGRILRALEESTYGKNTVVLFTSDHGEGIAMHHWNQKQVLYDQVTRVPLIISWEGKTSKKVYSGLVSNALDIPVTILDIAGVENPIGMRGQSLLPVIKGNNIQQRVYVVSETMFAEGAKPLGGKGRMIRTKKYKYCIYDNGENREQLFDLEKDPLEMNNLAKNINFCDVLAKHRKLIKNWAEQVRDSDFCYGY
ncbi:sulfatase-like hydrolase/transferase [Prolixibacteraceae bacterium Z1-6]|uniref:Sulfatase-like hydrolase/transferase n=1 Tax=Draconibacterium aestuarii TaxID=2998507 RepID=A0A9X3J9H1_9BACT|nr:sulfatase-like hydrolase/transferase [Prolixibacteraceae bacterium Z1-6]